jgi:peptide deformylase
MILPILAFGDPILRKTGQPVPPDYKGLHELVANMWETMYNAHGVGLAAPQVGKSINLFVVDTAVFAEDKFPVLKQVFINAEMLAEWGTEWEYEEGCLSIPHIRENVSRPSNIRIRFQDETFKWHEQEFDAISARVIQHEYDHCKGVLFIDHLSEFKRRLLKNKLVNISKGAVKTEYKMRVPM